MVLYKSTRGISPRVTFQQALLSGYAPDGGLYIPETLPQLTKEEIKTWAKLPYKDLVLKILRFFISSNEITTEELKGMLCILNGTVQ